jgi:TRAP transporter TAXI family solute receptor
MSGNEGGKYHEVAKALSKLLFQKGLNIEVKTSSGSRENLTALTNGISDLALLQNDISNSETLRSLTILYEEALHLIVRKELTSVEQLAGSTVSIGNKGGGTEGIAVAMLKQLGIEEKNIRWNREDLNSSLKSLQQGSVDCVCIVTGVGNATISKFLGYGNLTLLPIGSDPFEALKLSYPFIHPVTIPSGVYPTGPGRGLPSRAIKTVGTKVVLACNSELEAKDGYEITRLIDCSKAEFTKTHPLFGQMSSPKSILLQHPIHEGAQLHYDREKPSFIQEWADTIALIFSLIAVAWGAAKAVGRIYLQKLKDNLDKFFAKVDRITSELIEGVEPKRAKEIAKELHKIRRETTKKLIAEELAADDSFVIFQRQLHTAQQMVNETLRKSVP